MRVGLQAAGAGAAGGGGGGGGGWEGWEGWDYIPQKKERNKNLNFTSGVIFVPTNFWFRARTITTVNGVEQLRFFYGRPIGLWGWGRGGQFAFEKKIKIFTQENNSRKK